MYTSSSSEPDADLLSLLRARLAGDPTYLPTPAPETHVLTGAEHVADTALDVALDMVGCKRAAAEVAERMRRRRYGRGVWREHELHPGRVGEGRGRFVLGGGSVELIAEEKSLREEDERIKQTEDTRTTEDLDRNNENEKEKAELENTALATEKEQLDTAAEDSDQTLVHSTPNNEVEADDATQLTVGMQSLEIQTDGSGLEMSGFLEKEPFIEEPVEVHIPPTSTNDPIKADPPNDIKAITPAQAHLPVSRNKELDDDQLLHFIFTIDLLNFSFWTDKTDNNRGWTISYRGQLFDGYWGLCAAVWRALDAGIPFTSPSWWASDDCTEAAVRDIFRSETSVELPLVPERFGFLKQAADVLDDDFAGSLPALLAQANNSAAALVNMLAAHFSCFRDEVRHEGQKVRFLKRAQIFAADLWAAFDGEGYGRFGDVDKITMFADYRVPQMLHALGALWYGPKLEAAIRKGEEIKAGAAWEVEIRGTFHCSVFILCHGVLMWEHRLLDMVR